jgi:hypothetical protein
VPRNSRARQRLSNGIGTCSEICEGAAARQILQSVGLGSTAEPWTVGSGSVWQALSSQARRRCGLPLRLGDRARLRHRPRNNRERRPLPQKAADSHARAADAAERSLTAEMESAAAAGRAAHALEQQLAGMPIFLKSDVLRPSIHARLPRRLSRANSSSQEHAPNSFQFYRDQCAVADQTRGGFGLPGTVPGATG